MRKILIAAIVCSGMGAAGGWFVAGEIKKVCPVEEWKEVENKKESRVYEVKGKWKDSVLELTK